MAIMKRIGGTSTETMKTANTSSGKTETESAKTAHTRRREQVRRAQRNHRERKEKYIKSLEREVLRLRDEEAAIIQDSKTVQEENEVLKEILARHGIPLPDVRMQAPATVSVYDSPAGGQGLRVDMSATDFYNQRQAHTSPFTTSMSTSSPDTTVPPDHSQKQPEFTHPAGEPHSIAWTSPGSESEKNRGPPLPPLANVSQQSRGPHSGGLDAPEIGIDFVLSLEQPCLNHTRGDPGGIQGESEDPTGHVLTASAPLLTHGPTDLTSTSQWQVPAVEIERLLELSAGLNLEGEVTPVQAWSRLRQYPQFAHMDRDRLEGLKLALIQEVQCYGFGAVVDEAAFEDLVRQSFHNL